MNEEMLHVSTAGSMHEEAMIQASMSQVEMTVWLCVMAVLATGMLAILSVVSG